MLEALTGRRYAPRPAELPDHVRRRVAGRSYPGALAEPGARTPGVLYRGLDAQTFALLDAFEGDFYRRRVVRVETSEGEVDAQAYVVPARSAARLAAEPWDPERFRARELPSYLEACRRFRR